MISDNLLLPYLLDQYYLYDVLCYMRATSWSVWEAHTACVFDCYYLPKQVLVEIVVVV